MDTPSVKPIEYASIMMDDIRVDRLLRRAIGWTALLRGGFQAISNAAVISQYLPAGLPSWSGPYGLGNPEVFLRIAAFTEGLLLFAAGLSLLRRSRSWVWLGRVASTLIVATSAASPIILSIANPSIRSFYLQPPYLLMAICSIASECTVAALIALMTLPSVSNRMLQNP